MRNWITLIENATNEDLDFEKIGDHKIVLDDPADDEVKNLEKASPEKRQNILRDLEKVMHEDIDSIKNAGYSHVTPMDDFPVVNSKAGEKALAKRTSKAMTDDELNSKIDHHRKEMNASHGKAASAYQYNKDRLARLEKMKKQRSL